MNNDLYPELTDEGKLQAHVLMQKFEKDLKSKALEVIEGITTDFYCDILHEIETDHWTNYRTKILNSICNYSNKEGLANHEYKRIREAIFREHKEEIIKDLNNDLLKEIEMLKDHIQGLQF